MDITKKIDKHLAEEQLDESIFGEFGKLVMNMGKLALLTKELNKFAKTEAEKIKKKKGKISKDEYGQAMKDITVKLLDKVSKSSLPDNMKAAMIGAMRKNLKELTA